MVFSAVFAAWVAPHNPFDLATLNLLDASLPRWQEGGQPQFLLGTDDQGRDVFSAISLAACGCRSRSVPRRWCCPIVLGVGLGLLSGYVGGRVDAFIIARLRRDCCHSRRSSSRC